MIDYRTAEKVATIRVGDHPQRVREGQLAHDIHEQWSDGGA